MTVLRDCGIFICIFPLSQDGQTLLNSVLYNCIINCHLNSKGAINPCPAEPGYVLPLQTV